MLFFLFCLFALFMFVRKHHHHSSKNSCKRRNKRSARSDHRPHFFLMKRRCGLAGIWFKWNPANPPVPTPLTPDPLKPFLITFYIHREASKQQQATQEASRSPAKLASQLASARGQKRGKSTNLKEEALWQATQGPFRYSLREDCFVM